MTDVAAEIVGIVLAVVAIAIARRFGRNNPTASAEDSKARRMRVAGVVALLGFALAAVAMLATLAFR